MEGAVGKGVAEKDALPAASSRKRSHLSLTWLLFPSHPACVCVCVCVCVSFCLLSVEGYLTAQLGGGEGGFRVGDGGNATPTTA